MIKIVIFDFGGVLAPGGFDASFVRSFAEIYGVAETEIVIPLNVRNQLMNGRLSTEKFFESMNSKFPGKPKVTPEKLLDRSPVTLTRSKIVYELAKQLRAASIRTGIFSNVMEFLAKIRTDHGDYDDFDPVFLSCRDKMAKPDPAYYKYVLKDLDLPTNEILFIDDKEQNLIPAQMLGMRTILAISPAQIVEDAINIICKENADFNFKNLRD